MNERVLELAKAQIADSILECLQLRAMIEYEREQHKAAMSKFADEQYSVRRKLEQRVEATERQGNQYLGWVATWRDRADAAEQKVEELEQQVQNYKELLGEDEPKVCPFCKIGFEEPVSEYCPQYREG